VDGHWLVLKVFGAALNVLDNLISFWKLLTVSQPFPERSIVTRDPFLKSLQGA
jgi:hypothetical protein